MIETVEKYVDDDEDEALDISGINLDFSRGYCQDLPSRRCYVQITAITDTREPRVCDCVHDINENVLEASSKYR